MAVAELPLPPFPYEKDFFGSPFPKGGKTISSLGKFPKNQLTPNGLPAHQIKQNTKDKLSQVKWIFGLKTNRSVIKGEAYYV